MQLWFIAAMAFTLPPLPYDYAALEPHIDARTMEIHHTKVMLPALAPPLWYCNNYLPGRWAGMGA